MFLWFAFKRQQEHFYQEADAITFIGNRTAANFPTSELYITLSGCCEHDKQFCLWRTPEKSPWENGHQIPASPSHDPTSKEAEEQEKPGRWSGLRSRWRRWKCLAKDFCWCFYEYALRQLWDVELCLCPHSPPVPENNVWGNPEQAGTGLWKWLPLRGHSLQSLYSPPPLGQSGDRDKITCVFQSWQKTYSLTCYPNKYTWKGWGGKTTAARIIPMWFCSMNVLPRRNTLSAPVQYLWWLREHFCTPAH